MNIKLISISESPNKKKKLRATFSDGTKTDFGNAGSSDFTISKDEKLKKAYIARHSPREDFNDFKSAGSLARWILWEKTDIQEAIKSFVSRFNL